MQLIDSSEEVMVDFATTWPALGMTLVLEIQVPPLMVTSLYFFVRVARADGLH